MKLSTLLQQPSPLLGENDIEITGLSLDSRNIPEGGCFLAYPGYQIDRRDFMPQASEQAAVILYDPLNLKPEHQTWLESTDALTLAYEHLGEHVGELAARFYQRPSEDQHVMAVTGTNGKSSIVHGLNQLYSLLREPIAMLGTIGVGTLKNLKQAQLTTPDPIQIHQTLYELRDSGIENIAIEASSHALSQNRLKDVAIDVAILTQISRDHLDYHKTLEQYIEAKCKLYQFNSVKYVVMNLDCPYFYQKIDEISMQKTVVGYSLTGKTHPRCDAVLIAENIDAHVGGLNFTVQLNNETFPVVTKLLGEFNVSNLLAMMSAMLVDGFTLTEIIPLVEQLKTIPGRLEVVSGSSQPLVVVDYAHTPDALEKALMALKPLCRGRLIGVFGAGGERDIGKRAQMGEVAARLCNQVILTDDNPRGESPEKITDDILLGMKGFETVQVIHDRGRAIQQAIQEANVDDCILIAGKGHETKQVIGDKSYDFNDAQFAKNVLYDGSQL